MASLLEFVEWITQEVHGKLAWKCDPLRFRAAIFATGANPLHFPSYGINGICKPAAKIFSVAILRRYPTKRAITMIAYIYCLFSTEDGVPRYVGQTDQRIDYRVKQHKTAALEKESGVLYDWIRDVFRRGHDIESFVLQEDVLDEDVDLFEQYWISQFASLLNAAKNPPIAKNTGVAEQVIATLQAQLELLKLPDDSPSKPHEV